MWSYLIYRDNVDPRLFQNSIIVAGRCEFIVSWSWRRWSQLSWILGFCAENWLGRDWSEAAFGFGKGDYKSEGQQNGQSGNVPGDRKAIHCVIWRNRFSNYYKFPIAITVRLNPQQLLNLPFIVCVKNPGLIHTWMIAKYVTKFTTESGEFYEPYFCCRKLKYWCFCFWRFGPIVRSFFYIYNICCFVCCYYFELLKLRSLNGCESWCDVVARSVCALLMPKHDGRSPALFIKISP